MRFSVSVVFFLWCTFQALADPFVRFEEEGKVGLKDQTGKVVIPPTFEALGWSDGNFSVIGQLTGYKLKDHWGVINLQKQFVTPAEFETLTYPGGDRFIVSKKINPFTVKYGCLDLTGKVAIPFQYDGISLSGLRAIVFVKNGTRFEYGVIDLNDKGIIPLRFRQIKPIGTLRYAIENENGKTALFSEQGNQLTEFAIDSISSYRAGLAFIYQNLAQGIIDREGEIRIKPVYRELKIKEDGIIGARNFDDWTILDAENRELQKIQADELEPSSDDSYRIQLAGKMGILDNDLKTTLPLTFDFVSHPDAGNRVVGLRHRYGVIRKNNTVMLPVEFDSLVLEKNFIRTARQINGKLAWSLYDTFGIQKTNSYFDFIGSARGSFFPATRRGYWGAVNRYGEEFINCVFDSLLEFKGDQIAVKFRGQYGIIDKEEKWLVMPQAEPVMLVNEDRFLEKREGNIFLKDFKGEIIYFTSNQMTAEGDHLTELLPGGVEKFISFQGLEIKQETPGAPVARSPNVFALSEGLRGIERDGKFGFVDSRGRLRIANRYDSIAEFHEGLAPIKLIGKWGYVDVRDKIAINPNYESVTAFVNGLAIVQRNGKTGVIDKEGKAILPFRYDTIRRLHDLTFLIVVDRLFGLADTAGSVLIEPRFDHLQNLENGFVIAGRDRKFGLLTLQGLSIVPMIYDKLVYKDKGHYLALKRAEWRDMK